VNFADDLLTDRRQLLHDRNLGVELADDGLDRLSLPGVLLDLGSRCVGLSAKTIFQPRPLIGSDTPGDVVALDPLERGFRLGQLRLGLIVQTIRRELLDLLGQQLAGGVNVESGRLEVVVNRGVDRNPLDRRLRTAGGTMV